MKALLKNAMVYANGEIKKQDMLLDGADISVFTGDFSPVDFPVVYNSAIFPGFCDVHVHFREPGFCYKETVKSGSMAAARGGYTAVCTMPNLIPPPDNKEHLDVQLDAIKKDAVIAVHPYGTITKDQAGEELSMMDDIAPYVIGFSDDGKGIQTEDLMTEAMIKARSLGKMIVAHCEDNSLLKGGYIHDGAYAREHGHRGICSESEYGQIARDLNLVKTTGCKYHVCHISTKESVEIIRKAKAEGLDVTCETGPHYLTLSDSDLKENGRFKMNPPLRDESDKLALIEGVIDGTIDVIATDHAPHSAEEKSRGLEKSMMGVVGIETAFPVMYTHLVKTGIITLEKLIHILSVKARERFELTDDPGFTVWDLSEEYGIDPNEFISLGKSTPFDGMRVFGKCLTTVYNNEVVYDLETFKADKKSEDI